MLTIQSNRKKPLINEAISFVDKHANFRLKNKENKNMASRVLQNNNQISNQKELAQNFVPLKDYKLKIKKAESFLSSKIIKRKISLISNIYRPKMDRSNESQVKVYMEGKNMDLIKENIKKFELNLSTGVPNLLENLYRNKLHFNSFSNRDCKTQRSVKQLSRKEQKFEFPLQPQQSMRKLFAKRKISLHFDRSKYFNCESFLNKQEKNGQSLRQKTENRINTQKSRQKKVIKEKTNGNRSQVDEMIPIIRQRTKKPKTAGGFLKKYSVEEICIRPDFELHLNEEDLF